MLEHLYNPCIWGTEAGGMNSRPVQQQQKTERKSCEVSYMVLEKVGKCEEVSANTVTVVDPNAGQKY
jgi:hypothetical protein